jgi:hypothetical protein
MVIRDIKREMPLKYWSFKVAEWIARIGTIGFVLTFITYFGFAPHDAVLRPKPAGIVY